MLYSPTVFISIMAQFKNINPYLWPGWVVAALATLEVALVLLFFTETRSMSEIRGKCSKCSSMTRLKLSLQLRTFEKMQFLVSSLCLSHIYMYFCQ